MNKVSTIVSVLVLLVLLIYPTYKLARNFANARDTRMQHTSYNFSKYLRYGSL
jgi:hypothetical protein